jgi:hypothetical protein
MAAERLGKAERDLAERRVGRPAIRDDRFLLKCSARSRWPDGSKAASLLNGCRGRRGGLFVFG